MMKLSLFKKEVLTHEMSYDIIEFHDSLFVSLLKRVIIVYSEFL